MTPPAISIQQINKSFGSLRALNEISFDIAPGEFFGLLGPNGAGKTTLISILSGLSRATSGQAYIMGFDVVKQYRDTRRLLGVVPQELVFDPFFTVRECLRIQSGYFGIRNNDAWIDEILHHLDLVGKADTNTRALSGGMKRRVMVAQALVHKPPVIILDEPTAGVDVELRQSLWQFIKNLNSDGHTIVLTTHYLEEAETLCNRIAMLKQGKVVALDSKDNFLSVHSARQLRLKLLPDVLPTSLLPLKIGQNQGQYILGLQEYSQIETILQTLREANIQIEAMELTQPDLEEVFVKIMHRQEASL